MQARLTRRIKVWLYNRRNLVHSIILKTSCLKAIVITMVIVLRQLSFFCHAIFSTDLPFRLYPYQE